MHCIHKKIKYQYILIVCLLVSTQPEIFAQSLSQYAVSSENASAVTEIKIGEKLPNNGVLLKKALTGLKTSLDGKLIILDFWNIWCSPCIKGMPKMQDLQKQFNDKIQIVLVTTNKKDEVDALRKKNKGIGEIFSNVNLPIIYSDTELKAAFDIQAVPTHVWIDGDFKVLEKTNGQNSTLAAVQQFLATKQVSLPRFEPLKNFSSRASLFSEGGGRLVDSIKQYSLFTGYIPAPLSANRRYDSLTNKLTWFHLINHPAEYLYRFVYENRPGGEIFARRNRYIFDSTFRESMVLPEDETKRDAWLIKNAHSFEIKVPLNKSDQIYTNAQADIDRYFNVHSHIELRDVICYVLSKIKDVPTLQFKGDFLTRVDDIKDGKLYMENYPVSLLAKKMEDFNAGTMVLDETGISFPVKLEMQLSLRSLEELNKQLAHYGLAISKETRKVKMVIIHPVTNH